VRQAAVGVDDDSGAVGGGDAAHARREQSESRIDAAHHVDRVRCGGREGGRAARMPGKVAVGSALPLAVHPCRESAERWTVQQPLRRHG
jgi:hypothetical protein